MPAALRYGQTRVIRVVAHIAQRASVAGTITMPAKATRPASPSRSVLLLQAIGGAFT